MGPRRRPIFRQPDDRQIGIVQLLDTNTACRKLPQARVKELVLALPEPAMPRQVGHQARQVGEHCPVEFGHGLTLATGKDAVRQRRLRRDGTAFDGKAQASRIARVKYPEIAGPGCIHQQLTPAERRLRRAQGKQAEQPVLVEMVV